MSGIALFAQSEYSTPILTALTALLAVGVPAYIAIKKLRQELQEKNAILAKDSRNGVIGEWQEITDRLQSEIAVLTAEGKAMRLELTAVYKELSAMRTQIAARETERVEQRSEIRTLEKAVQAVQENPPAPEKEAAAKEAAAPGANQHERGKHGG